MSGKRSRGGDGIAATVAGLPQRARLAALAGGLSLLVSAAMLARPVGGGAREALGNVALLLAALAAVAGMLEGRRVARSQQARRSWTLLALAALAGVAGQAAWTMQEVVLGQPMPFPSVAFTLFVLFHLLLASAAVLALRPARDPQLAIEIALDGLLFLLAAAALGLRLVLEEPVVNDWLTVPQASAMLLGQVATAASFFFVLLLMIWKDTDLPLAAVYGLAVVVTVFLMGNLLLVAGLDPRPDRSGDPFELVWLAGWLALAATGVASATHPRAARVESRTATARRIRHSIIPASAVFLAVAAIDAVHRPYFTRGSTVVLLAMGVVAAIRVVNALGATEREAERRRRAEAEAFRARVRTVVARLHPHFVLNALNAVSELIRERSPVAEESVYRLSTLLRYTLEAGDDPLVPLRRELRATEEYLHLERLRLGDRLGVRTSVQPAALDHYVPPLLLQPLVENAVRHGLARRPGGGRLTVRARVRDGFLEVEVADNGPGADRSLLRTGGGLGLRGVRAQLRSHYGHAARMRIRTELGAGFRVRLRIPPADAP